MEDSLAAIYYVDTSAWLKRYVEEEGSDVVAKLFASAAQISCSVLGRVEITAAISRRGRAVGDIGLSADLQAQIDRDWQRSLALGGTDEIWNRAIGLAGAFGLRAADAVHLASADYLKGELRATAELAFVCSDFELNQAAQALGLKVIDPTRGPV